MVHSSLADMLLWFRHQIVTLTTNISRMYLAVLVPNSQLDLHRFVWREDPDWPLVDYPMTRLTFGVSASSFVANMAVKQNTLENVDTHSRQSKRYSTNFMFTKS